jgi:hypothetical protein
VAAFGHWRTESFGTEQTISKYRSVAGRWIIRFGQQTGEGGVKKIITAALLAVVPLAFAGSAHASSTAKKPPASCVRALTDAEQLAGTEVQLSNNVSAFFRSVQQSAQGHASGTIEDTTAFLNEIAGFERTLTTQANGITD